MSSVWCFSICSSFLAALDACLLNEPCVETLPVLDNFPAVNASLHPSTYAFTCAIWAGVASGGALNSTIPELLPLLK